LHTFVTQGAISTEYTSEPPSGRNHRSFHWKPRNEKKQNNIMLRDVSSCNTYNYGDALYWDGRYIQEAGCGSFDWYQRYSALRPFLRHYVPTSSRALMVGCGNASNPSI
ncbi:hypothetical protein HAX54_026205, partial [Datura stramonium]|nr:hypothetical protein [Datura stramonium]